MEDYKETMLEMIRGNKIMIDSYLSSNPSDKTKKGVVKKTGFSKYSVEVEGKIYDDIPTIGGTCAINEVVRVMIPQNQYSNMFIIKGVTEAELIKGLSTKVDKVTGKKMSPNVPFDGTNNIQLYDDTKSAYTKSFFNSTDETKRYFKICTIRNEGTYSNGQVEFEIMNRRFFSAKVNLSLRSGNDRIMNGILKVSGNDYGREFIRAFRYIGSDNVSYVEIWGTLVPWDNLNVYTKTINMYGTSIIWNNQRYDNYPTDFEIEIRKRCVGEISYDKREPVGMSTGDIWYQEL